MGSTRPKRSKEVADSQQNSPVAPTEEKSDTDKCPQCPENEVETEETTAAKENWVRCDACKVWFHWRCVGEAGDLDTIDKWFCKPCQTSDPKRVITLKPPARKSARKKPARDYAKLHNGVPTGGVDKWWRLLEMKEKAGAFTPNPFPKMAGSELTLEWADSNPEALLEPILIESPEGLGMTMPSPDITVREIARTIGEEKPVEVMDVATQSNSPGYTLDKWATYIETPSEDRDRIRNVISLEISETRLGKQVIPPRIVRELDWVEKFWPSSKKGPGHSYPKVQLYCLMGVEKAWTDWHIDFAGSSVYYHILSGAKTFFFVRPTAANLAAYEKWSGSEMQTNTWLGDLVDTVYRVDLKAGNTMIIPTGWIHSVYTPMDTIVFGGNFLHSYNIATQLQVREIENATRVPKKFQFPFFTKLCWYVGDAYLKALKAREDFSSRILKSVNALARFLVSEARLIEQGKNARDNVPADRVKDAPALARELRWRIRMALSGSSDVEDDAPPASGGSTGPRSNARKRRREVIEQDVSGEDMRESRFKNFVPKRWDAFESRTEPIQRTFRSLPPGLRPPPAEPEPLVDAEWAKTWVQFDEVSTQTQRGKEAEESTERGEAGKVEDGEKMEVDLNGIMAQAEVEEKREVVVRVRRTDKGLERQRIVRTVEIWDWHNLANGSDRKEAELHTD